MPVTVGEDFQTAVIYCPDLLEISPRCIRILSLSQAARSKPFHVIAADILATGTDVAICTSDDATSITPNPKRHRNKQATLHIMKDLLQCNHWDEASKWLTARYIQHNPNVASGREGVVKFFGTRPKTPTCDKLTTKVVAVLADGDVVTVVMPRELKDPKDPSKTYTTTWFDMWRFVDGKADEHWDPAMKMAP